MNCDKAQLAMMEHMEKTIHPERARDLTKHILTCESCREYYIGFDMALDVLQDAELSAPPVDFTQNVMAQVRKQPVHSKPVAMYLRVLWGFGAIFLGIALLFAFNPEWLSALTEASPAVYAVINALNAVQVFFSEIIARVSASVADSAGLSMFNIAIVFVVTIGVLLLVLHRSEKRTDS